MAAWLCQARRGQEEEGAEPPCLPPRSTLSMDIGGRETQETWGLRRGKSFLHWIRPLSNQALPPAKGQPGPGQQADCVGENE